MFDPIRAYDKPEVILTQLANGIATTDSVRRVLIDPSALSPRERETFVDRMKDELGRNPVTDTALDVLTNPFVWLGVLASAGGAPGVRNVMAGKRFFGAPTGYGAYVAKNFPFLRGLGLTSGQTESVGRRAAPLGQWAASKLADVQERLGSTMDQEAGRLLDALSRKHGVQVTRFEPENAPTAAVAEDLRMIRSWMHVKGLGLDQDRTERVFRGIKPARYFVRVGRQEAGRRVVRPIEVSEDVFDELNKVFNARGKVQLGQVLDPTSHRDLLERMPGLSKGENMLQSMQARGLDRVSFRPGLKRTEPRPVMDGKGADMSLASVVEGGPQARFEEVARPALVNDRAAMDAIDREFGLSGFLAAENKMYELGKVLRAGDEQAYLEGRGFVIDRDKLLRTARSQVKSLQDSGYLTESGNILGDAHEQVRALLGDEVAGALIRESTLRKGKIKRGATAREIEDVIVNVLEEGFKDPFYRPRNTVVARNATDQRIPYNPYTDPSGAAGGGAPGPSKSTFGRTRTSAIPWDPRGLEYIAEKFGGTGAMDALIRKQRQRVRGQLDQNNFYRVLEIAPDLAASKYVASTARDYTAFIHNAETDPQLQAIVRDLGVGRETPKKYAGPVGAYKEGGVQVGVKDLSKVPGKMRPAGGYNWYDLMEGELEAQAYASGDDKFAVELWRKHILPATMGIKPVSDASQQAAAQVFREGARRLADSRFMRAVEKESKYAARFIQQMRAWGNDLAGDSMVPWQSVTRLLYGSHMGLNVGTVLVNLLQPLQSIHQLGFRNTVKAYAQSFEQIGTYLEGRAKLGPGATKEQLAELMQKSFARRFGGQVVDMSRIGEIGNTWSSVEAAGFGTTPRVGKPQFSLLETMMKPFQLSETLNRTVTANAVLNAYEGAGRVGGLDAVRAQQDAFMAVQQFQFGTSPINRPSLFYQPFFRNPALRQFAQYGIRSFANLFTVPVQIGGERTFAGMAVKGRAGATLVDLSKMMAVSAVAYEIGKSAIGVDVSRGLALGFTDIFPSLEEDRPSFYVPPVVDLGWQAARLLGTGDLEILKDFAPRVLPGGIAISRALGVAPPSEVMQAVGLQKTFADWRQAESGQVPVFNTDGRYMGQFPTSDVVLRSFGADMGRFNNPQELSQFLLKNRDAIREGRRQYIAAMLGNNFGAAKRVKNEFERRFGMPLTVTQDQVKQAIKLREESVVSRTLETIDKSARDVYRQAIEETLPGQLAVAEVPGQPTEQGDMYRWGNR